MWGEDVLLRFKEHKGKSGFLPLLRLQGESWDLFDPLYPQRGAGRIGSGNDQKRGKVYFRVRAGVPVSLCKKTQARSREGNEERKAEVGTGEETRRRTGQADQIRFRAAHSWNPIGGELSDDDLRLRERTARS